MTERPAGNRYQLAGRVAVVTGGARGLGLAIARRIHASGCRVHIFDVADTPPDDLPGFYHAVDITRPEALDRTLDAFADKPTLLVNNAGITRDRTLVKMADAEWHAVIDTNLTGAFNMMRAVAPSMIAAGGGRIVNISSINGLRGKFGQANYAAAKAGLIGLTKTAARELGPKGITVNAVAPGMFLSEMMERLPREVIEKARAETVTGRLASVEEVADAVLYLLSAPSACITGNVLKVDAGQYL